MWVTADSDERGSWKTGGWRCSFTHALGRRLVLDTSSRAGPGFLFVGGNGILCWGNFRIAFLVVLHAVKKMCSVSAGRIKPCSSTAENWYLQIRSCFVFHFLCYNSSWLLFPCESTFILKLLPWAEVLWKTRLQVFFTLSKLSEKERERGRKAKCVRYLCMCLRVHALGEREDR